MKYNFTYLFILLIFNFVNTECSSNLNFENNLKVFAHGAGEGLTPPGNTLLAIMRSIYYGVNGIEIDLQKTKDDIFVLYHDDSVENYNFTNLNCVFNYNIPRLIDLLNLLKNTPNIYEYQNILQSVDLQP